ncbi:MAG: hypothetical protein AB7S56_05145 [Halothiobacillaceae bacterium]
MIKVRIIKRGGLALVLGGLLWATAGQADELHDYALIAPEHLPHLLHNVNKIKSELKLTTEQEKVIHQLATEMPPKMLADFKRAQALEKDIAREVVTAGKTAEDMAGKLDELQGIKRKLTDLQISALNTMRKTLSSEQYQLLLKDADWQRYVAQ